MAVASFVLNVLGPTELRGPALAGDAIARQPKRLAMLAYLALSTAGGYRRRDQVIGLFWDDQGQARARTYLRKVLHGIREDLGVDPFLTRGEDEIRVDPAVIACDAVQLAEAAGSAEWARVLTLYRGELLDGVFVEGAGVAFQEWLDTERRRLRGLASRAASALSKAAANRGDLEEGVARARVACALAPDDEEAVRCLMGLLDRRGDRGSALRVYTEWQARLFTEYGVEPAPETRRLANRVRSARRGESLETPPAPLPAVPADNADAVAATPETEAARPRSEAVGAPTRRPIRTLPIVLACTVFLAAITFSVTRGTFAPTLGETSIALLPLRSLGGSRASDFAGVVSDELSAALIRSRLVKVRVANAGAGELKAGVAASDLGESLRVAFLLEGSVQVSESRQRVTLRLLRTRDAVVAWADSYDLPQDSLVAVAAHATAAILGVVTSKDR